MVVFSLKELRLPRFGKLQWWTIYIYIACIQYSFSGALILVNWYYFADGEQEWWKVWLHCWWVLADKVKYFIFIEFSVTTIYSIIVMLHRFYCFCKLIYSSLFRQMHETFFLVIYVPKHMDHISAMQYTGIYIYGFHGGPHWSCWEYRMSQIARISLGCSIYNPWASLLSQGVFWEWVRPTGH